VTHREEIMKFLDYTRSKCEQLVETIDLGEEEFVDAHAKHLL